MIQHAIAKLFGHHALTAQEAEDAMLQIMSGEATPAQIGAYLGALRVKGEGRDEIVGSARAMREKSLRVTTGRAKLVDTCGTGGDKSGTFNISTTAAFAVAGAGVPVAKHGNRAASSQSGSADVLAALGVKVDLHPEQVGRCIDAIGIGFMLAPVHHPAMKHAAGPRRELGARTIFNILGPLTNPAGARHQLLGVSDPGLTELMAGVLGDLGSTHVLVICGTADGKPVDEMLTTGEVRVSELKDGRVTSYALDAAEFGFPRATLDDLGGGSPDFNAAILRSVLEGAEAGPRRDVVLLNAGAAIYAADAAPAVRDGIAMAREAIDSGRALDKLEKLIAFSNAGTAQQP